MPPLPSVYFFSTAWSSPSCVVWREPGRVYQLGIRNEVAAEFLNSHRFTTFTELWMWRLCFLEMSKSNFYRQKSYLTIFVDHLGTIFWDHVLTTMGPLGAHLLSDCIFILHLPPISCSIVRMCRRRAVSCVLLMVPSTPCHPSLVGFYWEPRACRLCSRLI